MSRHIVREIFILPIRFYQKFISPAIAGKNACLYTPTCSAYAKDAILTHGVIKGLILGLCRLLRCNRFFLGGSDPIPEEFSFKQIKNQFIVFHR